MSQQTNRKYATDINDEILEVINRGETLAARAGASLNTVNHE